MAYFPAFIEIENKKCLIAGGGKVALRKARVLCDFGADVCVMAPDIMQEIKEIEAVACCETEASIEDIEGYDIVIAATGNSVLDHNIAMECKKKRILVNSAGNASDCSFIFPAYTRQKDVVAAFSSGGQSPVVAQYLKEEMEKAMPGCIGDIACCIGNIRKYIKKMACTWHVKKEIYNEILKRGIKEQKVPCRQEIEDIIDSFINNVK